jgi:hypothetical protein
MFAVALALFCALIFTGPALYAQGEGLLIVVAPLSQEQAAGDLADLSALRPDSPLPPEQLIQREVPLPPGQLIKIVVSKPAPSPVPRQEKRDKPFWNYINKLVYEDTVKIKEEKRILREKWAAWLGIDIFYPYYKAKEVQEWVYDRTRVKIFNLRGRFKFENKMARYTFSMKF